MAEPGTVEINRSERAKLESVGPAIIGRTWSVNRLLAYRDSAERLNLVAHALPGLNHEAFRTLFLHLEETFLGLVYEFAEGSVIGGTDGALNSEEFPKEYGGSGQSWPL